MGRMYFLPLFSRIVKTRKTWRPAVVLRIGECDGMIELTTPHGQHRLLVEMKRSYLNQSLVNSILGRARHEHHEKRRGKFGSAAWTVRDLARAAGISKTKVAQLRQQFLRDGILTSKSEFRLKPETSNRLISGYSQILRPKLFIGRFRHPEPSPDEFLTRLRSILSA